MVPVLVLVVTVLDDVLVVGVVATTEYREVPEAQVGSDVVVSVVL